MQPAPNPAASRYIEVPVPVPFNAWAATSNAVFYRNLADPLRAFRTLGSADPLLPRALGLCAEREGIRTIHEIGTGNFNFAKRVLQNAPGVSEYNAFDFSDSSFTAHRDTLPQAVKFRQLAANQVRGNIRNGNTHIVGVELCDDLPNEYWTSSNGKLYELWMNLGVNRLLSKETLTPPKVPGAIPLREGLSNDIDAVQLSGIIGSGDWKQLERFNPGILNAIGYTGQQFQSFDLSRIFKTSWFTAPPEFRPFGERILEVYREQLLGIKNPGEVVHLPAAAILLLWQFRDLPNTTVHLFDYGYDSLANLSGAYSLYQGQVTTPVNFGLLGEAARIMGYDVALKKDREFIHEQTGEDARIVNRLRGLGLEQADPNLRGIFELQLFGAAATALCPDALVSEDTISSLRIRLADARRVASDLGVELSYKDGSYHLMAKTPQRV